ncbi:hypothetical protein [Mycoplasma amphoriforme]|uniref:Enriched in aromatic and glycine residues box domain-containing protein n=1 Tax=Mycoplasma amphoriforme A39 TaxID=572419 RepID=A0A292IHY4_9MOLU|nr:unnamed protein product [Mycoplasma amphoriforme A39]
MAHSNNPAVKNNNQGYDGADQQNNEAVFNDLWGDSDQDLELDNSGEQADEEFELPEDGSIQIAYDADGNGYYISYDYETGEYQDPWSGDVYDISALFDEQGNPFSFFSDEPNEEVVSEEEQEASPEQAYEVQAQQGAEQVYDEPAVIDDEVYERQTHDLEKLQQEQSVTNQGASYQQQHDVPSESNASIEQESEQQLPPVQETTSLQADETLVTDPTLDDYYQHYNQVPYRYLDQYEQDATEQALPVVDHVTSDPSQFEDGEQLITGLIGNNGYQPDNKTFEINAEESTAVTELEPLVINGIENSQQEAAVSQDQIGLSRTDEIKPDLVTIPQINESTSAPSQPESNVSVQTERYSTVEPVSDAMVKAYYQQYSEIASQSHQPTQPQEQVVDSKPNVHYIPISAIDSSYQQDFDPQNDFHKFCDEQVTAQLHPTALVVDESNSEPEDEKPVAVSPVDIDLAKSHDESSDDFVLVNEPSDTKELFAKKSVPENYVFENAHTQHITPNLVYQAESNEPSRASQDDDIVDSKTQPIAIVDHSENYVQPDSFLAPISHEPMLNNENFSYTSEVADQLALPEIVPEIISATESVSATTAFEFANDSSKQTSQEEVSVEPPVSQVEPLTVDDIFVPLKPEMEFVPDKVIEDDHGCDDCHDAHETIALFDEKKDPVEAVDTMPKTETNEPEEQQVDEAFIPLNFDHQNLVEDDNQLDFTIHAEEQPTVDQFVIVEENGALQASFATTFAKKDVVCNEPEGMSFTVVDELEPVVFVKPADRIVQPEKPKDLELAPVEFSEPSIDDVKVEPEPVTWPEITPVITDVPNSFESNQSLPWYAAVGSNASECDQKTHADHFNEVLLNESLAEVQKTDEIMEVPQSTPSANKQDISIFENYGKPEITIVNDEISATPSHSLFGKSEQPVEPYLPFTITNDSDLVVQFNKKPSLSGFKFDSIQLEEQQVSPDAHLEPDEAVAPVPSVVLEPEQTKEIEPAPKIKKAFWESYIGNFDYGHFDDDNKWVWDGFFYENGTFVSSRTAPPIAPDPKPMTALNQQESNPTLVTDFLIKKREEVMVPVRPVQTQAELYGNPEYDTDVVMLDDEGTSQALLRANKAHEAILRPKPAVEDKKPVIEIDDIQEVENEEIVPKVTKTETILEPKMQPKKFNFLTNRFTPPSENLDALTTEIVSGEPSCLSEDDLFASTTYDNKIKETLLNMVGFLNKASAEATHVYKTIAKELKIEIKNIKQDNEKLRLEFKENENRISAKKSDLLKTITSDFKQGTNFNTGKDFDSLQHAHDYNKHLNETMKANEERLQVLTNNQVQLKIVYDRRMSKLASDANRLENLLSGADYRDHSLDMIEENYRNLLKAQDDYRNRLNHFVPTTFPNLKNQMLPSTGLFQNDFNEFSDLSALDATFYSKLATPSFYNNNLPLPFETQPRLLDNSHSLLGNLDNSYDLFSEKSNFTSDLLKPFNPQGQDSLKAMDRYFNRDFELLKPDRTTSNLDDLFSDDDALFSDKYDANASLTDELEDLLRR